MFIQTEETPNPQTLKFLPDRAVMPTDLGNAAMRDFRDENATTISPLAKRLFGIDGVAGVYLGDDFIAVTKATTSEWAQLKIKLLTAIMDHFTSGMPVIEAGANSANQSGHAPTIATDGNAAIIEEIKSLLNHKIRPAVAQDGGDIVFDRFEDGVVYLHLHGACSGCPSSSATLKAGVENMLKHYVPAVQEVRQSSR